jgi:hypothetical protein
LNKTEIGFGLIRRLRKEKPRKSRSPRELTGLRGLN